MLVFIIVVRIEDIRVHVCLCVPKALQKETVKKSVAVCWSTVYHLHEHLKPEAGYIFRQLWREGVKQELQYFRPVQLPYFDKSVQWNITSLFYTWSYLSTFWPRFCWNWVSKMTSNYLHARAVEGHCSKMWAQQEVCLHSNEYWRYSWFNRFDEKLIIF